MKEETTERSSIARGNHMREGRDDPEYWRALENRIHDSVRREAAAIRSAEIRGGSDETRWLAARSNAVSLFALAAAAAAAIIVARVQLPPRRPVDLQNLWVSALASRSSVGTTDALARVVFSSAASPDISALMISSYDVSSDVSSRSNQ
jgi:hypothetical protein